MGFSGSPPRIRCFFCAEAQTWIWTWTWMKCGPPGATTPGCRWRSCWRWERLDAAFWLWGHREVWVTAFPTTRQYHTCSITYCDDSACNPWGSPQTCHYTSRWFLATLLNRRTTVGRGSVKPLRKSWTRHQGCVRSTNWPDPQRQSCILEESFPTFWFCIFGWKKNQFKMLPLFPTVLAELLFLTSGVGSFPDPRFSSHQESSSPHQSGSRRSWRCWHSHWCTGVLDTNMEDEVQKTAFSHRESEEQPYREGNFGNGWRGWGAEPSGAGEDAARPWLQSAWEPQKNRKTASLTHLSQHRSWFTCRHVAINRLNEWISFCPYNPIRFIWLCKLIIRLTYSRVCPSNVVLWLWRKVNMNNEKFE